MLKAGLEVPYPNAVEKSALLMLLLSEGESTPNMAPLLDLLLTDLAEDIMSADPGATAKERFVEKKYGSSFSWSRKKYLFNLAFGISFCFANC